MVDNKSDEIVMGAHVGLRNQITKAVDFVCVNLPKAELHFQPELCRRGPSGYEIPVSIMVDGRRHPFRLQTPPLALKSFRQGVSEKGKGKKFPYSFMSFFFRSSISPFSAQDWKMQLSTVDSKVLGFLNSNSELIWPGDEKTITEVSELYDGLASDKVCIPKKQAEQPPLPSGTKEVEIEGDRLKDDVKKETVDKDGADAKQIKPYEPVKDTVGGEDAPSRFPAEFVVFPKRKGKEYICRAHDQDGKKMKVSDINEGMEVVTTAEAALVVKDGRVKWSLTAISFDVAQPDITAVCKPAKVMYSK